MVINHKQDVTAMERFPNEKSRKQTVKYKCMQCLENVALTTLNYEITRWMANVPPNRRWYQMNITWNIKKNDNIGAVDTVDYRNNSK